MLWKMLPRFFFFKFSSNVVYFFKFFQPVLMQTSIRPDRWDFIHARSFFVRLFFFLPFLLLLNFVPFHFFFRALFALSFLFASIPFTGNSLLSISFFVSNIFFSHFLFHHPPMHSHLFPSLLVSSCLVLSRVGEELSFKEFPQHYKMCTLTRGASLTKVLNAKVIQRNLYSGYSCETKKSVP